MSWKHTKVFHNIDKARIPLRLPAAERAVVRHRSSATEVLCYGGKGKLGNAHRVLDGQHIVTAVAGLCWPLVHSATAIASVVVTPDCPAEPEPVVQLLLAALIVGSLFKLKEIVLHEQLLDSVQDEKFLVAKAKARHRYANCLDLEPASLQTSCCTRVFLSKCSA
jgi:hypothetical protein